MEFKIAQPNQKHHTRPPCQPDTHLGAREILENKDLCKRQAREDNAEDREKPARSLRAYVHHHIVSDFRRQPIYLRRQVIFLQSSIS